MHNFEPIPILIERLARIFQNDAHADGLKPTQWEALRYLARANRFSRSPRAVTSYLGMTKGTVSQTIGALERKGLVRKQVDPTDRRGVQLDVTEEGANALARDPTAILENAAAKLTDIDRSQLSKGLEKVLQQLLHERGGRRFDACKTCRHFVSDGKQGNPFYCSLLGEPLTAADSEAICIEQERAA